MSDLLENNVIVENEFNDYIEEEFIPAETEETYDEPDLTVDRAVAVLQAGSWFVKGYRDGSHIVTMGSWDNFEDTAKAELKDKDGNIVEPEPAPPTLQEQLNAMADAIMWLTAETLKVR